MHPILKPLLSFALSIGVVAACDRGPTGLAPREVDALLAASGLGTPGSKSVNTVLPVLFRESIAAVRSAQGRPGVEALLADWRELQEELKADAPTAGRAAIETKLAQIHAEELRVVHSVLGNTAVTRLVTETNAGLAAAGLTIDAARNAGHDVSRAQTIAQQVREKLAATTNALSVTAMPEALDRAAEAAGMLASLRHHLVELQRIEGLESLFPRAMAKVKAERGPAAAAAMTAKLEMLNARTRAALRFGNREASHETLELARAEQVRIVKQVLGDGAAQRLVTQAGYRAEEIAASLKALDGSGRDVVKQQRMLREAIDLQQRAKTALQKGDGATALDLGSHAAGLLNTLQHLTWY
jgi:hypothetical protein